MENKEINIEKLEIKADERGRLVELFKLPGVGQVFFSTTNPGFKRGNHYHAKHKVERFCVVDGIAQINLRNRETGEKATFNVSGDEPTIIDMPLNWTHNIINTGEKEMKLIVWVNEVFDPQNPDTYAEEV